MRSIRSGRRRRNHVNADIAVTNLIDVAFVLLIIFMITAPIMQGGIDVQLPEADSAPISATDVITLSITQNGEIWLEETLVSEDELRGQLESRRAAAPNASVHLKVDEEARYRPIARTLGILRDMGIADVGLPVRPLQQ
ncbi:MAG TPA: biopolymer transporter ExbD [Longimicrobiales bacterium]|nr:biopolymer transporter ExbD [Longimicrobiales bacterium]